MSRDWDEEDEALPAVRFVSDINMTPLVDVMLVLLIIVLLALPAVQQVFSLDLPAVHGAQRSASSAAIDLTLLADGRVLWGEVVVAESLLESRFVQAVQAAQQANRDLPSVRLYAERKVPYERVMAALAVAQRNGLTRLDLVTHEKAQPL